MSAVVAPGGEMLIDACLRTAYARIASVAVRRRNWFWSIATPSSARPATSRPLILGIRRCVVSVFAFCCITNHSVQHGRRGRHPDRVTTVA